MSRSEPICVLTVDMAIESGWLDPDLEEYVERVVSYAEPERCGRCGSGEVYRHAYDSWSCLFCRRHFSTEG